MPFYADKEIGAISNILSFLNPKNFLEAATVWHFMQTDSHYSGKEVFDLADKLDKLKSSGAKIFDHKDTCLTARVERIKGGMTNACFKLKTLNGIYFLRIPGEESDQHIFRPDEAANIKTIEPLGFNIKLHFIDEHSGLYVSDFIENGKELSLEQLHEKPVLSDIATLFKTLHSHPKLFTNTMDTFSRLKDIFLKINQYPHVWQFDRDEVIEKIREIKKICDHDKSPYVPCHNDPTYKNFMYEAHRLRLLDWEYSANNKALYDLANFAMSSGLNREQERYLLHCYYSRPPSDHLFILFDAYKQLTRIWYYLWAELQMANKSDVNPLSELMQMAHVQWKIVQHQPLSFSL